MAVMCVNCFSIYKRKYKANLVCKEENCSGYLVEIDENFLLPISILNKKGYYTDYCCSGHIKDIMPQAYISFYNTIELPYLPKSYKHDYEIHPSYRSDVHYSIRIHFDTKNEFLCQTQILQSALDVLEWAISLPDIK